MQLYALHDYNKDLQKRGCFPIAQSEASDLNNNGYGIFFTPNSFSGTRLEKNLCKLKMWYVDLDGGNKNHMENTLSNFSLEPTLLIETRNGYHAYWKCEPNLFDKGMLSDYVEILEGLVKQFGGDQNAMGTNRVLRVPNFYHCKDPRNKFLVKEVYSCSKVYTVDQMRNALPSNIQSADTIKREKRDDFFSQVSQDDFWQKVFDLDCFQYLPMLSNAPECNGEVFRIERVGSKGKIFVDGEMVSSCWIDTDGKIGSHGKGGPSLGNWVAWYGNNWGTVAECLKRQIPELNDSPSIGIDFENSEKWG